MSSPTPLPYHNCENSMSLKTQIHWSLFAQWPLYSSSAHIRTSPSPTCAHSTCCLLHLDNSRVMHHFKFMYHRSCHSSVFHALSHAAGPRYQTTVNLGRGATRSTSVCLRCLVSACFDHVFPCFFQCQRVGVVMFATHVFMFFSQLCQNPKIFSWNARSISAHQKQISFCTVTYILMIYFCFLESQRS